MKIIAGLPHEEQVAYWRDTVRGELVAEIERLRAALEPLARLKVPPNPQGNAGAYSICHADIINARAALEQKASTDG